MSVSYDPAEYAKSLGIDLAPWQQEYLRALMNGHHAAVVYPRLTARALAFAELNSAAEAMMQYGQEMARQAASMTEALEVLKPPKNLPHDPRLRKDRRKWGGR